MLESVPVAGNRGADFRVEDKKSTSVARNKFRIMCYKRQVTVLICAINTPGVTADAWNTVLRRWRQGNQAQGHPWLSKEA